MRKVLFVVASALTLLAAGGFVLWEVDLGIGSTTGPEAASQALTMGIVSAILAVVCWFIALRNSSSAHSRSE